MRKIFIMLLIGWPAWYGNAVRAQGFLQTLKSINPIKALQKKFQKEQKPVQTKEILPKQQNQSGMRQRNKNPLNKNRSFKINMDQPRNRNQMNWDELEKLRTSYFGNQSVQNRIDQAELHLIEKNLFPEGEDPKDFNTIPRKNVSEQDLEKFNTFLKNKTQLFSDANTISTYLKIEKEIQKELSHRYMRTAKIFNLNDGDLDNNSRATQNHEPSTPHAAEETDPLLSIAQKAFEQSYQTAVNQIQSLKALHDKDPQETDLQKKKDILDQTKKNWDALAQEHIKNLNKSMFQKNKQRQIEQTNELKNKYETELSQFSSNIIFK